MTEFIRWFSINYPEYKEALLKCHHNFDDSVTNPYHVEGDCWSHTMMVCKIAELKGYNRVVQVSALLHDIGKPQSRKINPKNNHVQFFGHEKISAEMAKPLVADLVDRKMLTRDEADEVLEIIRLHGEFYKNREKIKEYLSPHIFEFLRELNDCDYLGRFSDSKRQLEIVV